MSEVELEVTALAAGGDGVARDAQGRVTFVPRTAVGDKVRVRLVEEKKRFARGEVSGIVMPSRDRVEPPCPFFKLGCGGCQWQHITRDAQLAAKQAIVEGTLRKLPGVVIEKVADPAPPYGWRRRARFHVVAGQVGLFAYATNQLIPIDRCPQLEPALDDALRAAIAEKPSDGELHLLLGHDGTVAASLGETPIGLGGAAASEVIEIEPGLQGRAVDFAQASRAGNAALIAIARAALGKPARSGQSTLLELYAGAGNLTRGFVEDGWKVIASDVVAPAKPLDGVRFELGSARDVAKRLAKRASKAAARTKDEHPGGALTRGTLATREEPVFDAIVLDPPRTGAADALEAIAALRARTIVYVSCDPATLARDAEALGAAGYRTERAWPIDMMPQTSHVEVVLKLVRA